MENSSARKSDRVLRIYLLAQGEAFTKKELAQHFHVTERSIQRDLGALGRFLEEHYQQSRSIISRYCNGSASNKGVIISIHGS